jgi:hypothetical protein
MNPRPTPKLARDPLDPPTQRLQPQDRRDLVLRPHLVSPQDLRLRHRLTSAPIHLDPPGSVIQRVQFLVSLGVQFYMSPDTPWERAGAMVHRADRKRF